MPVALAIPAIISAVGSISGGAIASRGGNAANATQQQAALRTEQIAKETGDTAAKGITDASTAAATGVNQATASGIQGANDLTREGIQANETGTNNANMTLADLINKITSNQGEYTGAGNDAIKRLRDLLSPGGGATKDFSFNDQDFRNSPGYQFELEQGQRALQRGAAATGKVLSGTQLLDAGKYSQGLASTRYGEASDRAQRVFQQNRENTLNPLLQLAGIGQTATQNVNAGTSSLGSQIAGNQAEAGRFAGNSLNRLGEFSGGLGLQGATAAGNFTSQGALQAGRFLTDAAGQRINSITGGANSSAANSIAQGNLWGNVTVSVAEQARKAYEKIKGDG